MDLTLFEIDLTDAELNAPFSNRDWSPADDTSTELGNEDSSGRNLRPLVAIAVVIGLALLARHLRSSGVSEVGEEVDVPA